MDIVIITRQLPAIRVPLLEQTLRTVRNNILGPHRVVLVDDDSPHCFTTPQNIWKCIRLSKQAGVGGAKNAGAMAFDKPYSSTAAADFLMFLDDDMYLLPGWDYILQAALVGSGVAQLGGWSHPFNLVSDVGALTPSISVGKVDAVAGGCQIMTWMTWRKSGPFAANAVGVGQSEDFALSQRILASGGSLGCVVPFVAIHCGITTSEGKLSVGSEAQRALAAAQILEHGLTDVRVI